MKRKHIKGFIEHLKGFIEHQKNINTIIKADIQILKDSLPVTSNPHILQWVADCQAKSFLNNKKSLSQNLSVELESLFGPPNTTLRLENLTKVWILECEGLTFNVFTAKNKGTSIEICDHSYEDLQSKVSKYGMIKFLKELHNLINK